MTIRIISLTIFLIVFSKSRADMATMQKMCDPETKPEEMEEIEKEKTASQKCLDQEMPEMPPAREICSKSLFGQEWPKDFAGMKALMCKIMADDIGKFHDFMICQGDEMKKKNPNYKQEDFFHAIGKCKGNKMMDMMRKMCDNSTSDVEMKRIEEFHGKERKRWACMHEKDTDGGKTWEECFSKIWTGGEKMPTNFDEEKKFFCQGSEEKNNEAMMKMGQVMKCQMDKVTPEMKAKLDEQAKKCQAPAASTTPKP